MTDVNPRASAACPRCGRRPTHVLGARFGTPPLTGGRCSRRVNRAGGRRRGINAVHRSWLWPLVGAMWLAASVPAAVAELRQDATRPDVIFIIADDMSDWIRVLDDDAPIPTPNLTRLARRGVVFTQAHAASPACNPSRTALLTGVPPAASGVYGNAADWRAALPDAVTLPQAFMRAGYRVEGAGKVFHHHLAGAFHDAASFHDFLPMPWPPDAPMPLSKLNGLPAFGSRNSDWGAWPAREADAVDVRTVDWCIDHLPTADEKPLFLACGLFRPHMPFFVPASRLDRHPANATVMPERLEHDLDDVPPAGLRLRAAEAGTFWQGLMEAEQERPGSWREAVRCYQAAVEFADAEIGRLLDALEASPRGRAGIIVFCSDNGYQLGEKDCWEKFTLWEKATRVPLIVVAPGVARAGEVCARPMTLLDVFPTLVELCGLDPAMPQSLAGESLVPLLESPASPRNRPAVMTYLRGNHAVRSDRWRYIRYADGDEELYDHSVDPAEHANLAADPTLADVVREHRRWLPTYDAPDAPTKKN